MIDVLVVEDDFMVATIHQRFVERTEGFRVVGNVRSGREGLAGVAQHRPDLVLLDVHLPDISGLDVLRQLRADGIEVGVIMITAAREADTVRAALRGGAASYLIKPFEYRDLVARLHLFRDSHRALNAIETTAQTEVDAFFGVQIGPPRETALPKGLNERTGHAVLEALSDVQDLSAAECAERLGTSRVTARRYLEHYVSVGAASVRLQYGRAGRPERRYRRT